MKKFGTIQNGRMLQIKTDLHAINWLSNNGVIKPLCDEICHEIDCGGRMPIKDKTKSWCQLKCNRCRAARSRFAHTFNDGAKIDIQEQTACRTIKHFSHGGLWQTLLVCSHLRSGWYFCWGSQWHSRRHSCWHSLWHSCWHSPWCSWRHSHPCALVGTNLVRLMAFLLGPYKWTS